MIHMNRHSSMLIILVFFVVLFGFFSPACGEELIFSTHPFANPAAIHKTFQPLIEYLRRETGVAIRLKIAPSYTAHVSAVGQGKADLAFVGPAPYVRIKDKFGGVELLARLRMTDDISDKMVVVCQASAPFAALADMRGRTFAFGDPQSYGSHYLPRWLLRESGVPVSALAAYDYVKSHDNVILSVLHGDFDAGGVRLDVYRKYAGRPLRVLAGPFLTPPHALICRDSLSQALQDKLRQSLLALRDRKVLERIDSAMQAFAPVTDSDFNQARQVIKVIEAR